MNALNPTRKQAALLLMAGRVFASVLTVITAGVLSRWWCERSYGEYRQVWLAFQAVSPLVTLGIPAALAYFLPQIEPGRQKAAVAQSGLILAGSGALIGLLTLCWPLVLPSTADAGFSTAVAAFGLYPVFALPLLIVETWLLAIHRSRTAVWFTVQTAVIQAAAAILPVLAGYGVAPTIACLTLATFVRLVIVVAIYREEYRGIATDWDPGFVSRLLAYAVPLGLSGIIGSFNLLLDRMFIAWWYDSAAFAIYSNGATEVPVVAIVSSSVAAVLAPEYVRLLQAGRSGDLLNLWNSSIRKTAILIFPLTTALLLFAPDAVAMLYSEKYLASVPIFRIYLLILPLRIAVYGSLLVSAGQSRSVFSSSVVGLLMAALLNSILVPLFGMPGAAAATILSVYAVAGMLLVCSARLLQVSVGQIFPWRDLAGSLFASLGAAAIAAVVTAHLHAGGIRLLVGLGTTCLISFAIQGLTRRSRSDILSVAAAVPFGVFRRIGAG